MTIEEVDTKLEAYKLIHDPTKLLSLLYSKYGDIEEDFFLLFTNQIFYNLPSHFNIIYKENRCFENNEEFLKRFYKINETKDRIPNLADYYKNYHMFFCRPLFRNYKLGKIIRNYEDNKAEIFYKNNYADTENELNNKEKETQDKKNSSSLSSLDNITNNKIIFDRRTKKIIENIDKNEMSSITLTLDSLNANNYLNNTQCLVSKRSVGSFEKNIYALVNYHIKKKINNKIKFQKNLKNQTTREKRKKYSSPFQYSYLTKNSHLNTKKNDSKNKYYKNIKAKNSLYSLVLNKNRINKIHNKGIIIKKGNNFFSPNCPFTKNNIVTKFEEFNKNRPLNNIIGSGKKNKTTNNNITTSNNTNTIKNVSTSNYKNFSKLSESLNKKKNITNITSTTNSNITPIIINQNPKNTSNITRIKKNSNITNNKLYSSSNFNNNNFRQNKKYCITKTTSINNNKQGKHPITNKNSNKNHIFHIKNKTVDFNSQNQNILKFNSNNNFENKTNQHSQSKNPKKNLGSKFTLVKGIAMIKEVITNPLSLDIKKYQKNCINKSINIQNNNNNNLITKEKKSKNNFSSIRTINSANHNSTNKSPNTKSKIKKNRIIFSASKNKNYSTVRENKRKQNKPKVKQSQPLTYSNDFNINIGKGNNTSKCNKDNLSMISPSSYYSVNIFNSNSKGNIFQIKQDNTVYKSNRNFNKIKIDFIENDKKSAQKKSSKKRSKHINKIIHNTCIRKSSQEFYDAMNINENYQISRNKKRRNVSNIIDTQSQELKSLKQNCFTKTNNKDITDIDDSNTLKKNNKFYRSYNLNGVDNSNDLKIINVGESLYKENKFSHKKKRKPKIILKEKGKCDVKTKKRQKISDDILNNGSINNRKKKTERMENSAKRNCRVVNKENSRAKSNNTITQRGSSFQMINVNRNLNLLGKVENKNKNEKQKKSCVA